MRPHALDGSFVRRAFPDLVVRQAQQAAGTKGGDRPGQVLVRCFGKAGWGSGVPNRWQGQLNTWRSFLEPQDEPTSIGKWQRRPQAHDRRRLVFPLEKHLPTCRPAADAATWQVLLVVP